VTGPFGGIPDRFEPSGGPSELRAVVLPGAGYSPAAPLLEFGRQGLLEHGWAVRQVWWDTASRAPDVSRAEWVLDQLDRAVAAETACEPTPTRWLVMAKSLGTLAVASSFRADAYVLFTPLLRESACVEGLRGLVDEGRPVLLVGGDQDEVWSGTTARSLGCPVVEVPGADHGLLVAGDAVRSAEAHAEVARHVDDFLRGLDP
jgi:hypothetical protein